MSKKLEDEPHTENTDGSLSQGYNMLVIEKSVGSVGVIVTTQFQELIYS